MLQAGNGAQHLHLHILGQAAGKALDVHFLRVSAAGLDKKLMPGLVGEADDFRLDAGAVPGAYAGNGAVVHGTAVEVFPDDSVGFLVGVGQVAHRLVAGLTGGAEGEGLHGIVSGLNFHFGKIDAPPVHPGGCAGFEPAQRQAQAPQIVRQAYAGVHSVRAGGNDAFAGDHRAVQVRSRGDDHGLSFILRPQLGAHPADNPILCQHRHDLSLLQLQMFLKLQGVLHVLLIFPPVCLSPKGVDCRALAPVEHPVLDAAVICRHAHFAAQGVQLPNQVTLAGAADGRIAGHVAHRVQVDGEKNGVQPQPGGRQCRLDAGMTRADDGYVAASSVIGHCAASGAS